MLDAWAHIKSDDQRFWFFDVNDPGAINPILSQIPYQKQSLTSRSKEANDQEPPENWIVKFR